MEATINNSKFQFALVKIRKNSTHSYKMLDGSNVSMVGSVVAEDSFLVQVNNLYHKVFLIEYTKFMQPIRSRTEHITGLFIPIALDKKFSSWFGDD